MSNCASSFAQTLADVGVGHAKIITQNRYGPNQWHRFAVVGFFCHVIGYL